MLALAAGGVGATFDPPRGAAGGGAGVGAGGAAGAAGAGAAAAPGAAGGAATGAGGGGGATRGTATMVPCRGGSGRAEPPNAAATAGSKAVRRAPAGRRLGARTCAGPRSPLEVGPGGGGGTAPPTTAGGSPLPRGTTPSADTGVSAGTAPNGCGEAGAAAPLWAPNPTGCPTPPPPEGGAPAAAGGWTTPTLGSAPAGAGEAAGAAAGDGAGGGGEGRTPLPTRAAAAGSAGGTMGGPRGRNTHASCSRNGPRRSARSARCR